MVTVSGESFEEIWKNANISCEQQQVHNLLLTGEINYGDVESDFIKNHIEDAKLMQQWETPKELAFNHGSFINMYGDGYNFIIEELKRKNDSNRACFSLINMEKIIKSGDDPIPSFLVQQFGLSKNSETLYLTSYYRALEIKNFLPINLAEMAYAAKKIKSEKPDIKLIELNIFIFTAHITEDFYCLRKTKFDTMNCAEITKLVLAKKYKEIVDLLLEKKQHTESGVIISGIYFLKEALIVDENLESPKKEILIELCGRVIEKMEGIRFLRKSTSNYKENLIIPTKELTDSIQRLIEKFEEVAN